MLHGGVQGSMTSEPDCGYPQDHRPEYPYVVHGPAMPGSQAAYSNLMVNSGPNRNLMMQMDPQSHQPGNNFGLTTGGNIMGLTRQNNLNVASDANAKAATSHGPLINRVKHEHYQSQQQNNAQSQQSSGTNSITNSNNIMNTESDLVDYNKLHNMDSSNANGININLSSVESQNHYEMAADPYLNDPHMQGVQRGHGRMPSGPQQSTEHTRMQALMNIKDPALRSSIMHRLMTMSHQQPIGTTYTPMRTFTRFMPSVVHRYGQMPIHGGMPSRPHPVILPERHHRHEPYHERDLYDDYERSMFKRGWTRWIRLSMRHYLRSFRRWNRMRQARKAIRSRRTACARDQLRAQRSMNYLRWINQDVYYKMSQNRLHRRKMRRLKRRWVRSNGKWWQRARPPLWWNRNHCWKQSRRHHYSRRHLRRAHQRYANANPYYRRAMYNNRGYVRYTPYVYHRARNPYKYYPYHSYYSPYYNTLNHHYYPMA